MKFKDLRIPPYFTLLLIVLGSTLIIWLPFLLRVEQWYTLNFKGQTFQTVYKHFDGPLYIISAKSWYKPEEIQKLPVEIPLPPNYFAAHLPLYPAFIRLFAPVLGYLKSMLFVNVLFSVGLAMFFYYFLKKLKLTEHPLALTMIFLFLPRYLVVRTVGSPESLFLLLILASIFFFEKKNYWLAGLFGGISVLAKSPGILLTFAYGLVFLETLIKEKKFAKIFTDGTMWRWLGIILVPTGFLVLCLIYLSQYGDFWAYFNSGDNIHLVAPFAAFNFQQKWVGTAWLEEIVYYFLMYVLTIVFLKDSKYRSFFYFPLVFITATLFVEHRDIARYSLPIWPFACIAFEKFFTSKKFLMAALIILPGIFIYVWNFLLYNVLPIADWTAYL